MKHRKINIKDKKCTVRFSIRLSLFVILIVCQASCKKIVDIAPPADSIAENAVFTNNTTAIAVLTGIYANMVTSDGIFTGIKSISVLSGFSSDELTLHPGITTIERQYYNNALSVVVPIAGSEHWTPLYNYIFKANAAIEGLMNEKADVLTPIVRNQLLGEAKFLRAFFYFYLVNLYGDVPLALTTDPMTNINLARSPKATIYQQIIDDLREAQELLSSDYLKETLLSTTTERIRPTKWTAAALLARVYLYTGDWTNAEEQATIVISNTTLYGLVPLNKVFLKNSNEAIWQLQPTDASYNTHEATTFVIPASGPSAKNPVYLSKNLWTNFEANDQRGGYGNWIDTVIYQVSVGIYDTVAYPFKYKINMPNNNITPSTGSANMTEFLMVLRLAEQFLIRAEARVQQNNINGAQADLNAIRTRAGLPNTTAGDKSSLLVAILHERQSELFTEWGNRWFDLKRTGNVDAVMSIVTPQKTNGVLWQSHQQWYPLPINDLSLMPNLTQNAGY